VGVQALICNARTESGMMRAFIDVFRSGNLAVQGEEEARPLACQREIDDLFFAVQHFGWRLLGRGPDVKSNPYQRYTARRICRR
jgi:hypothetical protein